MANPTNSNFDVFDLLENSGLNEDCLVAIFKFLDVPDLLKVCEIDEITFTKLMNERVMGGKLFDFSSMQMQWSILKIFKIFGRSMRRIRVSCVFFKKIYQHF